MRFWNIDFLRFIFAAGVVAFHIQETVIAPPSWLKGIEFWQVFVDFFFVISGFLLFYKLKPESDTWEFAKKRFFRLAPNLWMSIIIIGIISIFIDGIRWKIDALVLHVVLLNCVGFAPIIGGKTSLGAMWFLSVLFWVSLFYFYISKIFDKKYLNFIIWLLVMVCYAIYCQQNGFYPGRHTDNVSLVYNIGICRALASMGLGYFISMIYKSGFLQNVKLKGKIFISLLECFIVWYLSYYLLFSTKLPCKSLMGYIVPFVILFYFMLVRQGVVSKLLDNKILGSLGKYAFSIYCFHGIITVIFRNHLVKQYPSIVESYPVISYFTPVVLGVILGVIMYYLFEKPVTEYINKKLKGS